MYVPLMFSVMNVLLQLFLEIFIFLLDIVTFISPKKKQNLRKSLRFFAISIGLSEIIGAIFMSSIANQIQLKIYKDFPRVFFKIHKYFTKVFCKLDLLS